MHPGGPARSSTAASLVLSASLATLASACSCGPTNAPNEAPEAKGKVAAKDSASDSNHDEASDTKTPDTKTPDTKTPVDTQASPSTTQPSAGAPRPTGVTSPQTIPTAILPKRCAGPTAERAGDPAAEDEQWDGTQRFRLDCQQPGLDGWTKVAKAESYGAGSAYVSHAYRKDGWMLLFGQSCCSACKPDELTDCEPWSTARLYPPSDLVDCAKSKLCEDVGLCVQAASWCVAADDDWGLSL